MAITCFTCYASDGIYNLCRNQIKSVQLIQVTDMLGFLVAKDASSTCSAQRGVVADSAPSSRHLSTALVDAAV